MGKHKSKFINNCLLRKNEELLIPYNNIEKFITHKNGDYILNEDYTIKEFYDKYLGSSFQNRLWLGKINDYLVNRIKTDTGINLKDKSLTIGVESINHIDKHHNQNEFKKYGNPKPTTIDDYNYLADILNNYVEVKHFLENNENRFMFISKSYNDYVYYVIEMVPKNNKNIHLITMYTK